MATENLVTGKYYRILKDKANDVWDRISFWTHSDDVQTSSGITLTNDLSAKDTKITATQNDFATIESSSVASHAYVKGNMLVYGGQLYRAKTAISVGSTLTVGSNIEAVTVGTLSNMLTATNGNQFYFDVKDGKPGFYPSASKTASQFVPFGGTSVDVGVITLSETDSITVDLGYQPTLLILFNYGTSNIFITTYNSDFSSTSAFGGTYTTNTAGTATIYNFPVAAGSEGQLLSVNSNGFTVSKRSRYIDRYTLTLRYMAFRQNPF